MSVVRWEGVRTRENTVGGDEGVMMVIIIIQVQAPTLYLEKEEESNHCSLEVV